MGEAVTVSVGAAKVNLLTREQAVLAIAELAADRAKTSLVVTPNIDHIVRLETDLSFRHAYDKADLVLPDGWPVVLAARSRGARGIERVPGSDLAPEVARVAAARGLTLAIVGGAEGAAGRAADVLLSSNAGLRIVAVEPAPPEQISSADGRARLREALRAAAPNVLLLSLGTPKQEIFADLELCDLGVGVVLCIGAGLDFLAGVRRRAPQRWQRLGLEWFYRVLQEPVRLGPRYARAAPGFVMVLWRDRRKRQDRWVRA